MEVERNIAGRAPLEVWYWARPEVPSPTGAIEVLTLAVFTTKGLRYLRQRKVEYRDCEPVLGEPTVVLSSKIPWRTFHRLAAATARFGTAKTPLDLLRS
jgi:hypothetical protein